MDRKDARVFAAALEDWLQIPAFVCEAFEEALVMEDYEKVCKAIVERLKDMH